MMERSIVHLDLDSFFVSVERLQQSKLVGKPVIIGGLSDRGVVASCSYEARRFGVHSAMPMKLARRLCGEGVFIRGDMDRYSRYSQLVTDVIKERAPVYEKASIDEHYLDLTGLERFFGTLRWAGELRQTITRETGLPISFGLSLNKTVAKIATGEAKPNGQLQVPPPEVPPFLAPLSIKKIPMLGPKTYRLLRSMGVTTIEVLRRIPPDMMERTLGKNGKVLWQRAHGIDHAPVEAYHERKSISSERTFQQDTADMVFLQSLLAAMMEQLAYSLRKQQKLTACVTVKIRYANYDTHTLQQRIPYTAFDHVLQRTARELFHKLYNRRMLIRLLGVKVSHLVTGVQQLNMFEDTYEVVELYKTMDVLRNRFGDHAIKRASGFW